jgi:hypothetical protein
MIGDGRSVIMAVILVNGKTTISSISTPIHIGIQNAIVIIDSSTGNGTMTFQ